ncbi:uncharacterized protein [Setaria viridis]|uniref:uncharacterized protein n=1 Tax=Setaria viridis TaxID=4556 RepID=UPI003B3A9452
MAPNLFSISKRKNRSLREAITDNAWVTDIDLQHQSFSVTHFIELQKLWNAASRLQLRLGVPDTIRWKLTADSHYNTNSAYRAQFFGSTNTNFETIIWKPWAPPKCKFFSWLAIQDRIWTADRLQRRGWASNPNCALCEATQETGLHMFTACNYTRNVWAQLSAWTRCPAIDPECWTPHDALHDWWTALAGAQVANKKGLRSLIILVLWEVWKERNARVFQHQEQSIPRLVARIRDEATTWVAAGAMHLERFLDAARRS